MLLCLSVACKTDPPPPAAPRNVLLITIDTLRADALSIYGNKLPTPFFEKMADRSAVFTRAYTTAPITLPAHTSLLTGLNPPGHGVRNNGTFRVPDRLILLSEVAKENGLSTAAFIGAFPLAAQFGLNQGFAVYDDVFTSQPDSTNFVYAERAAEQVRLNAEKWVSANSAKPFFVWMHLFDPHHPYNRHDSTSSVHPYFQEVQYVDHQLDRFLEFLVNRNLLSDTLVIVTSDHGEAFGEHGEVSHSIFLYNTTLHVPLLISLQGNKPVRRNEVVSLIDIYPTVLELMNWKPGADSLDGRSLAAAIRGDSVEDRDSYAETLAPALDFGWSPLYAVHSSKFKFIEAPKPELYDLRIDPGEKNNLIASRNIEEYRKKIQAITARSNPESSRGPVSAEDREKLESLGYVASGRTEVTTSNVDPKDRILVARKIAELAMSELSLAEKAKAYEDITAQEASNPLLLLRYAEILLKLNQLQKAGEAFQRVISLNYPSASALNGLAAVHFQQKQVGEAKKLLERAVSKGIADGETYHNLAEIHFHAGNKDQAFRFYDEAIRLNFIPAFFRKAGLWTALGRPEEALQLLAETKRLQPGSARPHFETGLVYFRLHRYQEAASEFEQALQKEPASTWILFNIGVAYHRAGNPVKSRLYLERFLREGPQEMKEERAQAAQLLKG